VCNASRQQLTDQQAQDGEESTMTGSTGGRYRDAYALEAAPPRVSLKTLAAVRLARTPGRSEVQD
jgi:hypothetical protein